MGLKLFVLFICLQVAPLEVVCGSQRSFQITVLLPSEDIEQTKATDIGNAVQTAIDDVNARRQESTVRLINDFTLVSSIHSDVDTVSAAFSAVFAESVISPRSIAVVGPFYRSHCQVIAQLTDLNRIPMIASALSRDDVNDYLFESTVNFLSMFPRNLFGGTEIIDNGILTHFKFYDVALLVSNTTETKAAVQQFENFAQFSNYHVIKKVEIPSLSVSSSTFRKSVSDAVTEIKGSGVTIIVTSIEANVTAYHEVFSKSKKQGLVGEEMAWICLSLPSQSFFNESLLYNETIAAMEGVLGTQVNLTADQAQWNVNTTIEKNALLANTYDAVWAIALAIDRSLNANLTLRFSDRGLESLAFNASGQKYEYTSLEQGEEFLDHFTNVSFVGVSGHVVFQRDGTREPRFDVVNIVNNSNGYRFSTVAKWNKQSKLAETGEVPRWYGGSLCVPKGKLDLCRHRLQVLVASEYRPYIHYHSNREGNERFSGWAVEVFKYIIKGCTDNYNFVRHNGTWLEMLSELRKQDSRYDMALAPIPMTKDRLTDILFTRNIRTISIRPLVTRKSDTSRGTFQFLDPFEWVVWLCIVLSFIVAGAVIYLLETKRKQFSDGVPGFFDSIFYSFSTLTYTQDQDAVLTIPGRVFVIVVCFAVLILTSCFTANLTVFILQTDHELNYNSIEKLAGQSVGALTSNSMLDYLTASSGSGNGQTIGSFTNFSHMAQIGSALRNGTIAAFLDDDGALSLLQSEDSTCQLAVADVTYCKAHTGFAMRRTDINVDLTTRYNERILTAWDNGYFEELERRYFPAATFHSNCQEGDLSGSNKSLDMTHLGGVFILLCAITVICLLGNVVLTALRKNGILRYDLDHENAGVHATAQLIKRAIDTVSAAGSVASTPSGSRTNLHNDRVLMNGELNLRKFSPLTADGSIQNDGRHSNRPPLFLPPITTNDTANETKQTYSGGSKNPLPEIQTQ